MITNITAGALRTHIETNEVVYQFCGELVEVSNDNGKGEQAPLDNPIITHSP